MSYPTFLDGERETIDLVLAEASAILTPHGLSPGGHAKMFLRHHRDTIGMLRGSAGRKLRHGEIAELLIQWARVEGDPAFYALRALRVSLVFTAGERGALKAAGIFAPLSHPAIEEDRFLPFAIAVIGGRLTADGQLMTRGGDSLGARTEAAVPELAYEA